MDSSESGDAHHGPDATPHESAGSGEPVEHPPLPRISFGSHSV